MIRIVLAVVIGILLLGLLFKLLRFAIILALIIGGVVLVKRYLAKSDQGRIE